YASITSTLASGGSAPTIARRQSEECNTNKSSCYKPRLLLPRTPTVQSLKSDEAACKAHADYFQRHLLRPAVPGLPNAHIRAASAETSHRFRSWTPNNSPRTVAQLNLSKPWDKATSSELSLCSSVENGAEPMLDSLQDQQRTPEPRMSRGRPHAVALYDFDTGIEGDLQFRTGDIIMLEEVVDEAWYRGRSIVTGQVGIFPMNHVQVRIPIETGLYTTSQPRPTGLLAHQPPKGSPLLTNGFSPQANQMTSAQGSVSSVTSSEAALPRRPSRIRISSLSAKYDTTQAGPYKQSSTSGTAAVSDEDSNAATRTDPHPSARCTSPPIVSSLKPLSRETVSQLAEKLEHRGIAVTRVGPLPTGAKPLFPCVMRKPHVSSAPNERQKTLSEHIGPEDSRKPNLIPTPKMVETLLVKLFGEQRKPPGKEAPLLPESTAGRIMSDTEMPTSPIKNSLQHNHSAPDSVRIEKVTAFPTASTTKEQLIRDKLKPSLMGPRIVSIKRTRSFPVNPNRKSMQDSGLPPSDLIDMSTVLAKLPKPFRLHTSLRIPTGLKNPIMHKIGEPAPTVTVKTENMCREGAVLKNGTTTKTLNSDKHVEPNQPAEELSFRPSTSSSFRNLSQEVAEQQWLLITFDYVGTEPVDLTVKANQVVRCLDPLPPPENMQDMYVPDQWLRCVTWFGKQGQVPSTFVRRILDSEELRRRMASRPRVEALFDFNAETGGDLSLKPSVSTLGVHAEFQSIILQAELGTGPAGNVSPRFKQRRQSQALSHSP
ncbi:hypothetical protein CSKR_100485, partial [Clonorchis sinensis]